MTKRDDETDQELVLYEFIELLIRIAFWRANPFFGLRGPEKAKSPRKAQSQGGINIPEGVVPYPDCLRIMLHEVVLPNAQRDDSHLFKEQMANDKAMQEVLEAFDGKLRKWWDKVTQESKSRGEEQRVYWDQWQDLLKEGKMIGNWEIHQESDISGDERCRNRLKASLSLSQAKMAFVDSQVAPNARRRQPPSQPALPASPCHPSFVSPPPCLATPALRLHASPPASPPASPLGPLSGSVALTRSRTRVSLGQQSCPRQRAATHSLAISHRSRGRTYEPPPLPSGSLPFLFSCLPPPRPSCRRSLLLPFTRHGSVCSTATR